jgi:hypothetical protein
MSKVLESEAEEVARPAFRELLLEAAKDRLRQRFGAQITALAEAAIDQLIDDINASLAIEARIKDHQERREPSRPGAEERKSQITRDAAPGKARGRGRRK